MPWTEVCEMVGNERIVLFAVALVAASAGTLHAQLGTTPCWETHGDPAIEEKVGYSVARAGDVNGDGYDDVIVGAPQSNLTPGGQEGRIFVYHGSATGLPSTPNRTRSGTPGSYYGASVASAGDVNDDGYDDVIVGAPYWDYPEHDEGRVFLYLGSPSGLGNIAWSADSDQEDAHFGWSVAGAGDVNSDGYDDVIIGAPGWDTVPSVLTDAGMAQVYLGGPFGLEGSPVWTYEGFQAYAAFGYSVAGGGNFGGALFPQYDDVIVGAPGLDRAQGAAYIHPGSSSGPSAQPGWSTYGPHVGARYGHSVAVAGDFDGNGWDDIIVGAPRYLSSGNLVGKAYVYLSYLGSPPSTSPVFAPEGNQDGAMFGYCVASAGDIDDNVMDGVLIGAPGHDGTFQDEGSAFIYIVGLVIPVWGVDGYQRNDWLGASVASAGTTGPRLGDGQDVIVGAPYVVPVPGAMATLLSGGAAYVFCQPQPEGIEPPPTAPAFSVKLLAPRPSPFLVGGRTQEIAYDLPEHGWVKLAIHDAMGRTVLNLVDGFEEPGRHVLTWNGRDTAGVPVGSGVYFVNLTTASDVRSVKSVVIR